MANDLDAKIKMIDDTLKKIVEYHNDLFHEKGLQVASLGLSTGNPGFEAFISLKTTKEIIDKISADLLSQKTEYGKELENL